MLLLSSNVTDLSKLSTGRTSFSPLTCIRDQLVLIYDQDLTFFIQIPFSTPDQHNAYKELQAH